MRTGFQRRRCGALLVLCAMGCAPFANRAAVPVAGGPPSVADYRSRVESVLAAHAANEPLDTPNGDASMTALIANTRAHAGDVAGLRLGVAAGETATERALELAERLEAANAEKNALGQSLQELENLLARQEQRLQTANAEIAQARLRDRFETVVSGHVADERQTSGLVDALVAEQQAMQRDVALTNYEGDEESPQRPLHRFRERLDSVFHRHSPTYVTELAPSTVTPTSNNYGPGVSGRHLGIPAGETAAERSLELSAKLTMIEDEREALAAQVRRLETELRDRDRKLMEAAREIQLARDELATTRDQMGRWKSVVEELEAKIRSAERENLETLQAIVTLLKQFLGPEPEPPAAQNPQSP